MSHLRRPFEECTGSHSMTIELDLKGLSLHQPVPEDLESRSLSSPKVYLEQSSHFPGMAQKRVFKSLESSDRLIASTNSHFGERRAFPKTAFAFILLFLLGVVGWIFFEPPQKVIPPVEKVAVKSEQKKAAAFQAVRLPESRVFAPVNTAGIRTSRIRHLKISGKVGKKKLSRTIAKNRKK